MAMWPIEMVEMAFQKKKNDTPIKFCFIKIINSKKKFKLKREKK